MQQKAGWVAEMDVSVLQKGWVLLSPCRFTNEIGLSIYFEVCISRSNE